MNKKIAPEDLKVWRKFTSSKETIENKDYYLDQKKTSTQKIRKVDPKGLDEYAPGFVARAVQKIRLGLSPQYGGSRKTLEMLKGSQVDFAHELIGSSFKISNPKTKSSCGCGVSFSF